MFKPCFEPQELTFLTTVLKRACLDAGIVEDSQREVAAARIVRLAQTGQEDFETLRKDATTQNLNGAFGNSPPESRSLKADFGTDCFNIVNNKQASQEGALIAA